MWGGCTWLVVWPALLSETALPTLLLLHWPQLKNTPPGKPWPRGPWGPPSGKTLGLSSPACILCQRRALKMHCHLTQHRLAPAGRRRCRIRSCTNRFCAEGDVCSFIEAGGVLAVGRQGWAHLVVSGAAGANSDSALQGTGAAGPLPQPPARSLSRSLSK